MKSRRSYFRIPNRPDFMSPAFKLNLTEQSKKVFEDLRPGGGVVFYVNLVNGDIHLLPAFNANDGLTRVDKHGRPYEENEYTASRFNLGVLAGDLHFNGEDKLQLGLVGGPHAKLLGGGLFKSGYAFKFCKELPKESGMIKNEIYLKAAGNGWDVYLFDGSVPKLMNDKLSTQAKQKLISIETPESLTHQERNEIEAVLKKDLHLRDEFGIKTLRNRSTYENSKSCYYSEDFLEHFAKSMAEARQEGAHVNSIKRELPLEVFQKISDAICEGLGLTKIDVLRNANGMIRMHLSVQESYLSKFVLSAEEQVNFNNIFEQIRQGSNLTIEAIQAISGYHIDDLLVAAMSMEEYEMIDLMLQNGAKLDSSIWLRILDNKNPNIRMIEYLLVHNVVDIYAQDRHGNTPLKNAVQNDHLELVELLLQYHKHTDTKQLDDALGTVLYKGKDTNFVMIERLLRFKANAGAPVPESILTGATLPEEIVPKVVSLLQFMHISNYLDIKTFEFVLGNAKTLIQLQEEIPLHIIIEKIIKSYTTAENHTQNQRLLPNHVDNLILLNKSGILSYYRSNLVEIAKDDKFCTFLCSLGERNNWPADKFHNFLSKLLDKDVPVNTNQEINLSIQVYNLYELNKVNLLTPLENIALDVIKNTEVCNKLLSIATESAWTDTAFCRLIIQHCKAYLSGEVTTDFLGFTSHVDQLIRLSRLNILPIIKDAGIDIIKHNQIVDKLITMGEAGSLKGKECHEYIVKLCREYIAEGASFELDMFATQADNLVHLSRFKLLSPLGNTAFAVSKNSDVCEYLCQMAEQEALNPNLYDVLRELIAENKLNVKNLQQGLAKQQLEIEESTIKKITNMLEKDEFDPYSLFKLSQLLDKLTPLPFLATRKEFIQHSALDQLASTKWPSTKHMKNRFVLWLRIEQYLRAKQENVGTEAMQEKIQNLESALKECFATKPAEKAAGTNLLPFWLDDKYIRKVFNLNDDTLSQLFLKYAPAPRGHVFADKAMPEVIKKRETSSSRMIQNVLSKVDNRAAYVNDVIGVQRKFRAKKREKEEVARVSARYNLSKNETQALFDDANTPYTPQCDSVLAQRIIAASAQVNLANVTYSVPDNDLVRSFDDAIYGKRNALQLYLPSKQEYGLYGQEGDSNVIRFERTSRLNETNCVRLEFDINQLGKQNPSAFYKQRDLQVNSEQKLRTVNIGEFRFTFNHTYKTDVPQTKGLSRAEADALSPFHVSSSQNYLETDAYANIKNSLLISNNIGQMEQVLTLNFFRFIDALYDKDMNPDNVTKEKIYSELAKLDDKALAKVIQEIGSHMTDTMEFNFYAAYQIDFAAVVSLTTSTYPAYTLTLSTLITNLNQGDTRLLQEAQIHLPDIFKSHRFLDHLISQVNHPKALQDLQALKNKCEQSTLMNEAASVPSMRRKP